MARSKPFSNVDESLARNRLGAVAITLFVIAAAAPLTVVFGAQSVAYATTTFPGIVPAFYTAPVVLALFAVGFVAMSRHVRNAGAFYTYITHGLGKPAGVAAAAVALLAYNLMQVGLLGGFGAVAALIFSIGYGVVLPWPVYTFAAWAAIAVFGLVRVDLNAKVLAALLCCEVVVVVVADAVMISHPHGGVVDTSPLWIGLLLQTGGGVATVGAIASFVGFEATVVFSEEAKDARRTIARATFAAITIAGVLYAVSAWALPVAVGVPQLHAFAAANSTESIFTVVGPYLGQTFSDIGHFLLLTSLFAAALAFHQVVARYGYALGREGVAPRRLGRAARNGAPRAASLTQTALAGTALTVAYLLHADPAQHLLFWLTVVGGFGVALLMLAASVSVVVFFARRGRLGENVWRRVFAPSLAAIALTVLVTASVQQFPVLLLVAPTDPARWVFPAAFAAAIVVGLGWAGVLRWRRPAVYAAVGLGAHAVEADLPGPRQPQPDDVGRHAAHT